MSGLRLDSRISRNGSITIRRLGGGSSGAERYDHAGNSDNERYLLKSHFKEDPPLQKEVGSSPSQLDGVTGTLLTLRESKKEFERRQQQLDDDLQRLSAKLARTASQFSPSPATSKPSEAYTTPSIDSSAISSDSVLTNRFLDTQRRGNWRSPGPVRLERSAYMDDDQQKDDPRIEKESISQRLASTSQIDIEKTTNIHISRRGSISIEKSSGAVDERIHNKHAMTSFSNYTNSTAAIDPLKEEHQSSLHHLRAEVERLYSRGEDTQRQLLEAQAEIQTLRKDAEQAKSNANHNFPGNETLEAAYRETTRLRNQVDHLQALMSSKDAELRLLHAQQDRTMKLLETCTQRRDVLAEDNRLLRDELNSVLRSLSSENYASSAGPGEDFEKARKRFTSTMPHNGDIASSGHVHQSPLQRFNASSSGSIEEKDLSAVPRQAVGDDLSAYEKAKSEKHAGYIDASKYAQENGAGNFEHVKVWHQDWNELNSKESKQNSARKSARKIFEGENQGSNGYNKGSSPSESNGIPEWQTKTSPSPSKVFISANRRSSVVNPMESHFAVHNERTSSRENAEALNQYWTDRLISSWDKVVEDKRN